MIYEEQRTLPVIAPFRLDLTVWALRRRAKNLIDQWDGQCYSRIIVHNGKAIQVLVKQKNETALIVTIKSNTNVSDKKETVTETVKSILGTEVNLTDFYQLAKNDAYLQLLAEIFRGVKPPRFPSVFEALVNAIACQQVSLDVGILILNRLSHTYGKEFDGQFSFPDPEDISQVSENDLQHLGLSYQKARAILGLAKAIEENKLSLNEMGTLSNDEVISQLTKIRGIGRWSAEYVLLRGLGRLNIFPGDDVGAQRNLMLLMNLPKRPTYNEIEELSRPWKPYAGLVYFHLLLDKLQKKNLLQEGGVTNVL